VCMRLKTSGRPLPADLLSYVERGGALPGVKAWIDDALAEHDFIAFDEPYRLGR
jgi:glutathione S-transferase